MADPQVDPVGTANQEDDETEEIELGSKDSTDVEEEESEEDENDEDLGTAVLLGPAIEDDSEDAAEDFEPGDEDEEYEGDDEDNDTEECHDGPSKKRLKT